MRRRLPPEPASHRPDHAAPHCVRPPGEREGGQGVGQPEPPLRPQLPALIGRVAAAAVAIIDRWNLPIGTEFGTLGEGLAYKAMRWAGFKRGGTRSLESLLPKLNSYEERKKKYIQMDILLGHVLEQTEQRVFLVFTVFQFCSWSFFILCYIMTQLELVFLHLLTFFVSGCVGSPEVMFVYMRHVTDGTSWDASCWLGRITGGGSQRFRGASATQLSHVD